MKITYKKEGELIAHLRKGHVSIPKIQYEMQISYKEAHALIDYAIKRKWLKECERGNEYPALVSKFLHKELTLDACKILYDELGYDDLKVLYYLEKNFSATLQEILDNVDDDEDDMREALDNLSSLKVIFEHDNHYYCLLSRRSVKQIQRIGEKEDDDTSLDLDAYIKKIAQES